MAFRFGTCVGSFLCSAVALPAVACDLPKLPVIPAAEQIRDRAAVNEATAAYFDDIREYGSCIQEELAAAGGDDAPESIRTVYLARASAAVAEAQFVQQLFQERVAAGQTAPPGSEEALRKLIEGIASGTPDYDAMTGQVARMTRQQMQSLRPGLSAAGAIKGIEFGGSDPQGHNIFQVQHENSTTQARIGFDENGKIDFLLLRPQPPAGQRRPTATIPRRR